MMISTKGRYALRVLTDMAGQEQEQYVPLKEIADRQGISQKYLESIMTCLSKAGLLESAHGKGGGYRLSRSPGEYKIGEVLRLMEGSLAPVSCLECGTKQCERADSCLTLPMWTRLEEIINDYFDGISIADLLKNKS